MAVMLFALLGCLLRDGSEKRADLQIACAAALRQPMSAVVRRFEEARGVRVALQFGGSGALAGQLEMTGGDLFFPADEDYLGPLERNGRIAESIGVARLTPGLVVASGNPKGLVALRDLGRDGVRVALANKAAAIGKLSWSALEESGSLEMMKDNVVVTKPTVTEVVEDVALGSVDATIAWDAVAALNPSLEWIGIEALWSRRRVAAIAVMASSNKRALASEFARFVADRGQGGRIFESYGFNLQDEETP